MLRQGCFLSMLHRTCEKVHGGVRLGGLTIPNILCMPFYFKPRGIKKYSIKYIVKIPNTHVLFNRFYEACSENTLVQHAHRTS